MRVVIALGGNALLQRGEKPSMETQRENAARAARSIADVIKAGHEAIITHGNGPQVGLMALQDAAYDRSVASPLDVLIAESAGMIGYLIEQALANLFAPEKLFATVLTEIEVDPQDPAFLRPSKPVGPVYGKDEAIGLAKANGWTVGPDGDKYRRLVASPLPKCILRIEVIKLLARQGVTVICAGGGGIPVVLHQDGRHSGVEAVIDKDRSSALLARQIGADALLILTDVEGVFRDWGKPQQRLLKIMRPADIMIGDYPSGSMGPKLEAAASFVDASGKLCAIGKLDDALAILEGRAGTMISN
jgi:carbamate kinase